MKLYQNVVVVDTLGLHIRPAADIVKLLTAYRSMVSFTHNDNTVNAKSIIGLLSLAASHGAILQIQAEGDDAEESLEDLLKNFDHVFQKELYEPKCL